jgi:hypothetical protein
LIQDVTIIVLEKLIFSIGENMDVLKKQHQDLRRDNEGDTEILSIITHTLNLASVV